MAMTDSLLPRSTRIVSSQLCRKLPSMPDTSMAFTIMRVRRKGTCRTRRGCSRQFRGESADDKQMRCSHLSAHDLPLPGTAQPVDCMTRLTCLVPSP